MDAVEGARVAIEDPVGDGGIDPAVLAQQPDGRLDHLFTHHPRGGPLAAGDVVLVKPNEVHQFRNSGEQPMKFLCLIPNSATGKAVQVEPECETH